MRGLRGKMARLAAQAERVPFYRAHWASAGIEPESLQFPRDWARLPVVRKTDLLDAGLEARLDERWRSATLVTETTTGSSAQPFEMQLSSAAIRTRRLRFLRALLAVGYRPGERLMLVAARHSTPLAARLLGWTYAGLEQGESALAAQYLRVRPAVLYGPLSALLALADRLAGQQADGHRPRLTVSTAEELTPLQRRALSRVFGDRIADFYGMTEFGLMAWRGAEGGPYHMASRRLLMEFLPCGDDAALERLVVSDLSEGAMPLIRYETGDLVRRDPSLPGTPIVRFVGREIDCLRLPGGGRLSPYRVTMSLEGIEGLEQYQVVQAADLSVEVIVRTSAAEAEPIAEAVRRAVNYVCDGALPLRIKVVSGSGWPVAGKLRPVRSLARDEA
jgi:phenylacetate-CoA ligase